MSASASAARVVSTIVIWSLFTTIMGFVTLGGNVRQADMVWVVLVMAVAAMYSTRAVWRGTSESPQFQFDAQTAEKAKRSAKERLAKTLNALDDDEAAAMLEDFKSRLAGGDSDGEVSAVEMLRAERRHRAN